MITRGIKKKIPLVCCCDKLLHKGIRYIERYREFCMTIWRQHFFGAANVARTRTSPLLDFLSATYAFLRLDWCTGGWLICVDLDFQTCCPFPAAVMECESSIF